VSIGTYALVTLQKSLDLLDTLEHGRGSAVVSLQQDRHEVALDHLVESLCGHLALQYPQSLSTRRKHRTDEVSSLGASDSCRWVNALLGILVKVRYELKDDVRLWDFDVLRIIVLAEPKRSELGQ